MAERINERFRLERVVEEGPEGSWHRGVDEKNDKPVLVAITTRAADEWTRAAFEKLQEVGRRVSHPAVAKFVEAGATDDGSGYVVVDLPTGPTLADRLLITPPLSIHELVRMTISVLDGLQAAHRQGLVHGDIEPGSIVVTGEGRACLTRFGLNRAAAIARRVPCFDGIKLARSKRMAAPEIIRGEAPSVASDLYSIGAILYEAIAGRGHRKDESPDAEALPLRDARAQVPAALAEVVDKLLSDDPSARPDSASTLRRDLTQAMMKAPTVAKLKVATAIETPTAEPTQQLDIEDLEQPQGTIDDTLAAASASEQPATSPSEDAREPAESVIVEPQGSETPASPAASPAPIAEEKSKAPLIIGIAIALLAILALISMLGGEDEPSGSLAPEPAEEVAAIGASPDEPPSDEPEPAAAEPAAAQAGDAESAAAEPDSSDEDTADAEADDEPVEGEESMDSPAPAPKKAAPKRTTKRTSSKSAPKKTSTSTGTKVKRDPGF